MSKQSKNLIPQHSVEISSFCGLIEDAKKDYEWHSTNLDKMNGLMQDYLHVLELDGLDYAGRAKVATKLVQCRKERRYHKDMVEVLTPIVKFIENDKGRQAMSQISELLGQVRKKERYVTDRIYVPRVLDTKEDL